MESERGVGFGNEAGSQTQKQRAMMCDCVMGWAMLAADLRLKSAAGKEAEDHKPLQSRVQVAPPIAAASMPVASAASVPTPAAALFCQMQLPLLSAYLFSLGLRGWVDACKSLSGSSNSHLRGQWDSCWRRPAPPAA